MTRATEAQAVRVPYVDLAGQHEPIMEELMSAARRVLGHGQLILGDEVASFEADFAAYCGTRYAVGVANGTDAIVLALKAVGIGSGDEVITVPNSFPASASAIVLAGAKPVFVDVRDDGNMDPDRLAGAITSRTRAILPVHLTGRPADMGPILDVAQKHRLVVVEDAAQAVGARYRGRRAGSFGAAGFFSFHPLKNLSASGDGGIITTDDDGAYQYLLKARNHGLRGRDECEFWSPNSRLDALQAAMLAVKLKYLDGWTEDRRVNAAFYREHLAGVLEAPGDRPHEYSVYQTFVVRCDRRDELEAYLQKCGIEAKVHYRTPIHLQQAARSLGYGAGSFPVAEGQAARILSLPVYSGLSEEQKSTVVEKILEFYGS